MTHPLFDRHDVRQQADAPPAEIQGAPVRDMAAEQLTTTNDLLDRLLRRERLNVVQLCVSDREPPEAVMSNWPIPGAKRYIFRRSGNGGTYALPAGGAPTLLLAPNEARLGGLITNGGAGAVTLFLTSDLLTPTTSAPLPQGSAQILLPVGASWNFLLGSVLWSGTVAAVAAAIATVTVAEI